jgi:hypothetical protein
MTDTEYLPSYAQARFFREMNGKMKLCEFEGEQEKCSGYEAKSDKPGRVNLACLYYIPEILNGYICTAPPAETENK